MAQVIMHGARLSYVVVPQEGTVKRPVHKWKKGVGVQQTFAEEPAGFLVFFPRGHVIRIRTKQELRRYNLHKDPQIVSLQGLSDPNSPLGKLMLAQDEGSRIKAMDEMQQQVIRLAQAQSGKVELCRDASELYAEEEEAA